MKQKKALLLISVLVSMSGVAYIMYLVYAMVSERFGTYEDMPTNVSSMSASREISVSPPVPILMYHHIRTDIGNDNPAIYVSPERFETQLSWLFAHGFQTVSPEYFGSPSKRSGKPIVLTFDDGYRDAYETVFPLLQKYGFHATFYLIVDDIDKPGNLTRDEIAEMRAAGMNFGSHTLTHPNLTTAFSWQVEREISGSKKALEDILGAEVNDFCYPGGAFDENVANVVAAAGYRTATTTVDEVVSGKTDPLMLNRLNIGEETRFENLPSLNAP